MHLGLFFLSLSVVMKLQNGLNLKSYLKGVKDILYLGWIQQQLRFIRFGRNNLITLWHCLHEENDKDDCSVINSGFGDCQIKSTKVK